MSFTYPFTTKGLGGLNLPEQAAIERRANSTVKDLLDRVLGRDRQQGRPFDSSTLYQETDPVFREEGTNPVMDQDHILVSGTTRLQAIAYRILAFRSSGDHPADLRKPIAVDQLGATEGDIRGRHDQMDGSHLGKAGKTQQRLDQNRPIAQLQILFPGIAPNPAAAACGWDQNVNIHKFSRYRPIMSGYRPDCYFYRICRHLKIINCAARANKKTGCISAPGPESTVS